MFLCQCNPYVIRVHLNHSCHKQSMCLTRLTKLWYAHMLALIQAIMPEAKYLLVLIDNGVVNVYKVEWETMGTNMVQRHSSDLILHFHEDGGACHSLKKKHKFLTVQLSRVLIKHIFCVNMFQTPHPQFIIQALMTSSGLFSQINSKQIHLQTWNWCSDPLNVLNANKNPHEDLTVFKMKIWTFFNWNLNWI